MGKVTTGVSINDGFSQPMTAMSKAMNLIIGNFESLQKASGKAIDTSSIKAARTYLNEAEMGFNQVEEQIKNTNVQQESLNQKLSQGTSKAGSFVKAMLGLSIVQKIISLITGKLDSAMNRMDTMTNFQKTMTAITGSSDLAKASLEELKAITKGTAYGLDTAAAAVQNFTTRGMNIKSATKEVGNWADAVAFYGNGTNEQLSSVTDAIGKMLSKGTVEMDKLNTLTDAGINAVDIYAQATGKSTSEVQKALSSGQIASREFITTVSKAFEEGTNGVLQIAGAAKEAGGTWATSIANMKAAVTRGVISMIDSINNASSNAGFGTILDNITNFGSAMETMMGNTGIFVGNVITLLTPVYNLIKSIGEFFVNNWSLIAPIVAGIATAFLIYHGALLAFNIAQGIGNGLIALAAFLSQVEAASLSMQAGATFAATAAQYGFNAALLACPLTWIIIAIIAIIALIFLVVAAINKVTGSSFSAIGIITGAIKTAVAFVRNLFLGLLELVFGIIEYFYNGWVAFANFFANVFNDPVASIIKLFGDLGDRVLGVIQKIAEAIDFVFGSNLASTVAGWRSSLKGMVSGAVKKYGNGSYEEVYEKLDIDAWLSDIGIDLERSNYGDAYSSGYDWGAGLSDKVSNLFKNKDRANNPVDTNAWDNLIDEDSSLNKALGNTAGNTGKAADSAAKVADNTQDIADTLDTTEEDLKYLRDLAEQEIVNRFTTAEIKIDMTNNNNISSDMDLDGVVSGLEVRLEEAMAVAAEGYHF